MADLGGRLEEERRQREGRERELAAMVTNSDRLRERVRAYEASLRELHVDHESGASLREPHADHGSGDSLQPKSEALERLIAVSVWREEGREGEREGRREGGRGEVYPIFSSVAGV